MGSNHQSCSDQGGKDECRGGSKSEEASSDCFHWLLGFTWLTWWSETWQRCESLCLCFTQDGLGGSETKISIQNWEERNLDSGLISSSNWEPDEWWHSSWKGLLWLSESSENVTSITECSCGSCILIRVNITFMNWDLSNLGVVSSIICCKSLNEISLPSSGCSSSTIDGSIVQFQVHWVVRRWSQWCTWSFWNRNHWLESSLESIIQSCFLSRCGIIIWDSLLFVITIQVVERVIVTLFHIVHCNYLHGVKIAHLNLLSITIISWEVFNWSNGTWEREVWIRARCGILQCSHSPSGCWSSLGRCWVEPSCSVSACGVGTKMKGSRTGGS